MWQLWDDMAYYDASMWLDLVMWLMMWTNGWVSCSMLWGSLSVGFCHGGAHSGAVTWHTLSPLLFCILCASYTWGCCCPQVVPRFVLIKSQPLINSFNLFYLLWIYFNSSTCPKILKFSPKTPKFMVNTHVIFNSNFASVSLC
jgi:hypothetical protein